METLSRKRPSASGCNGNTAFSLLAALSFACASGWCQPPPGLAPAEARLATRELAISFHFCFPDLQAAAGGLQIGKNLSRAHVLVSKHRSTGASPVVTKPSKPRPMMNLHRKGDMYENDVATLHGWAG